MKLSLLEAEIVGAKHRESVQNTVYDDTIFTIFLYIDKKGARFELGTFLATVHRSDHYTNSIHIISAATVHTCTVLLRQKEKSTNISERHPNIMLIVI